MLELIFQGFLEWTYGLVLEAWEYFSSVLLDLMRLDFAYLRSHMPIIDTIMQIMLAVGWALLIGNLVFQAAKSMATGLGFEAEDPKLLFTRTFVFSFLLLASPQICRLVLDMTSTVIDYMEMPDAVDITFADEASFGGLQASWLLVMICGIIVMFQTFKLILEMAERYFVLAMLTITAPLAFGMGGSRNTSDIFTGWCRMFASMCLLMVMNVVFMKMLLSVLSFYPSGLDVLPWMVLVVTVVKVAKKADSILSRIGLNPAMTGDALNHGLPGALAFTVIRSMASNVAKAIGRAGKGATGPSRNGKPTGPHPGTPRGGAPSGAGQGGRNRGPAAAQSTIQTESNQQTVQQNTAALQEAAQQTVYSTSTASSSAANTQKTVSGKAGSRRTSVPKGAKRAPSHVQNTASSTVSNHGSATHQNTQAVQASASNQQNSHVQAGAAAAAGFTAGSVLHKGTPRPQTANPESGGRTTRQEQQAARPSAYTPSTLAHQVSASEQVKTSERRQAEQHSSSRERTASTVMAGMAQAAELSAAKPAQQALGSQPVFAESTVPGQAGASKQSARPRTEQRSTQRSKPAGGAVPGSASVVQNSTRVEQRNAQPSNRPVGAGASRSTAQVEQRSTQRQSIPNSANGPVMSGQSAPVTREAHAVQKTNVSISGAPAGQASPAQQETHAAQRPAAPAPVRTAPSGGQPHPAQQESRSTQRPAAEVPTAGPAPATAAPAAPRSTQRAPGPAPAGMPSHPVQAQPSAQAAPPTVPVQQGKQSPDFPHAQRQSRNPVAVAAATQTPIGTRAASTARQESGASSDSKAVPEQKRPVPAQQERNRPSAEKRDMPAAPRPGTAGMAAPIPRPGIDPGNPASTVRQEPAQSAKKPFVPLTGKEPRSIPSHLELKQTPQKTTKRPAETEELPHVPE